ncbi:DUF1553 domain-containing protein [Rhodopirellula sp. MGV]|uniref:DUF1553 domain-containing protein n=1 Tax=Rhodopirellula sp. MGV TaxID=2023130 RepID=UPI000B972F18|nr:DUF1553 domain-containing protein [Rhodopirellula sp. MGV]OYP34605.1 hypothetical protein CGZ80_14565 [Rhodopirellula sp. MGV]PNY37334.1 DUF1553 domain-containing protein [Rhodopirellula baltica]
MRRFVHRCLRTSGVFAFVGSTLITSSVALSKAAAEDTVSPTSSSTSADENRVDYNRDIRPIMADYCFACHGADDHSREAGLRLDQAESAIDSAAIVPGNPDESEMIARIMTDDPDLIMPPPHSKKTISEEQKATLVRWIKEGAEFQKHWAFVTPEIETPSVTADAQWRKNEIDDYVFSALKHAGLSPVSEAQPSVLFRRLHLDITGLPPSPNDRAEFEKDYAQRGDEAYSEWVDRLMSRPTWGEHRGRYWLDAARYGDTHGLHFDNYREMWPYRDWVIEAFNRNQPFDQFIVEQIAGDLLENPTESQLVATGFQRCNITTNEGGTIDEENLALYATDRVQTFGWVFLGLTTNCAQCHDHKFDPITMKDYYSLAAYFRNTTQGAKDGNRKEGVGPILYLPTDEDRPRWDALPNEIAAAVSARDQHRNETLANIGKWIESVSQDDLYSKLPTDKLAFHLPLDEGQGNALKMNGELDATVQVPGGLTWQSFDGRPTAPVIQKDGTIQLGPIGKQEFDEAFSLSAWIRVPQNGGAGIIGKMDLGNNYRGWDLYRQGNSLAVHLIDTWPESAIKATSIDAVLRPGNWQHVSFTYDGSSRFEGVKIYVDGKAVALRADMNSVKPNASMLTDVPFQIGSRFGDPSMEGLSVSELRLYRRALSDREVMALAKLESVADQIARHQNESDAYTIKDQERGAIDQYYFDVIDTEYAGLASKVDQLNAEKAAIQSRSPITHIQQEKDTPAMTHIMLRGQYDQLGEEVAAATPAALHPMKPGEPNNRLGLAHWLVDPANPLTARVTVNRFWQQVFGTGLVVTSEDFGMTGASPSNQALLDFLAVDFANHGWDVKRFYKQLFESATYRQAAITTEESLEQDPNNALISRGPKFRMDAEMVRDAALKSAKLLSPRMFGPGVKPYQPSDIWSIVGLPESNTRRYEEGKDADLYRRTVYSFWKRMAPPPNMEAFNAPSREFCVVRRERTNTPLQALVTLNDPQFVEAARKLAQDALRCDAGQESESGEVADDETAIRYATELVLCREITEEELTIIRRSLDEYRAYYESNPEDAGKLIEIGESPTDKELPATELAAWTLLCNQIMNLDEVLCK